MRWIREWALCGAGGGIRAAKLSYFRSASAKSFKIAGYKKIPGNLRNIRSRCFSSVSVFSFTNNARQNRRERKEEVAEKRNRTMLR
jgi:hypothetical protein